MDINFDHLTKLAKLQLSPEEKRSLHETLPTIIDYIAKLQEVNTNDVDARAYLTDAVNVFRDDEPVADLKEREAIIQEFPASQSDALEVPGVFH